MMICSRGCQMVYFHTKNSNLGKFWRVFQWKLLVPIFYDELVYLTAISYIFVYCGYLVCFMVIWYIFSILVFGIKKNLATMYVVESFVVKK
jgi:hypothetical protein